MRGVRGVRGMRGVPAGAGDGQWATRTTGMTLTQCMPVVGGARSSYTPIRVAAVGGVVPAEGARRRCCSGGESRGIRLPITRRWRPLWLGPSLPSTSSSSYRRHPSVLLLACARALLPRNTTPIYHDTNARREGEALRIPP